jgi:integrase
MRKPTLYKHRGAWYARIWDVAEKKYHAHALGVPVEGIRERRKEAEEAARLLADKLLAEAAEHRRPVLPSALLQEKPFLDFIRDFWTPESDYVRRRAEVLKKPLSASYLDNCHKSADRYLKDFPGFQGLSLSGITRAHIEDWMLWAAERGKSGKMINDTIKAMRVAVKWAWRRDIIDRNPFEKIEKAAHTEKLRGILTPTEIKKLVETPVVDPYHRLTVYLALYCSMRMGEVRGLLWGDISDGVIHICHNWQEGEGLKGCKMGSEGYVPMIRAVAELVNQVHVLSPLTGPGDFVLSRRPYHPARRKLFVEALRSELEAIGIMEEERVKRNIVFHSLRHSFVTACRIAGLSDFEVMSLSRHKDPKMLARYSHGQEALDLPALREKIDNSFGAAALPG